MAYEDRYGSTKLRDTEIDNLSINWDYEEDPNNKSERYPVLFFTPDMNNTMEHYHIMLDRKNAKELRDWLSKFLEDT